MLAQASSGGGILTLILVLIYLGVIILMLAGFWTMFKKAGQPGWAAIIPIVNTYFMCKVAGRPGWWVILMFIPIVSIIFWFVIAIDIAKSFGKGTGFGIGIALLTPIFVPILGFGSAEYQGPSA